MIRNAGLTLRQLSWITLICEGCGHRHRLAQAKADGETVHVVCHGCEEPLTAVVGERMK